MSNRNFFNSKRDTMQMWCAASAKMLCCIAVLAVAALAQSPASGPGWDMIGQNKDNSAQAASGVISHSEGSFDSATGMTCEVEVQCPNFQCPQRPTCSGQSSNEFTLQLNTNSFRAAQCKNSPASSCAGEEQFVFTNSQCQNQDFYPHSPSKACVYIEYWLQNYGQDAGCPSPFKPSDQIGFCVVNSTNYTPVPPQVLTNALLESLKLTGELAPPQWTNAGAEPVKVTGQLTQDKVTLTIGSTSYSAEGDNIFPELGISPNTWTFSEFNIFGDGHGSQSVFNNGTTLLVRTVVDSGTTTAPICNGSGNTLESNNLNLLPGTCSGVGGTSPAMLFTESLPAGHRGSTALLYDASDGQADVVGFNSTGNQSMDYPNTGFRTTWSLIAAGYFTTTSQQQVVLYDQAAGLAEVVAFNEDGKYGMDVASPGLGTSFNKMVAGYFIGNGREQVLLYNSNSGEADVIGFDANGTKTTDFKNTNFGNWDTILPAAFLKNGQQEQVFVYNRKSGHAAIVTFDSQGKASPPVLNTGFRTSWDLLVAGRFIDGRPAAVLLYDRAAGDAEVVGFDTKGGVIGYHTNHGFRTTWAQMVAGDFLQDSPDQILLYDQSAGEAEVVGFDTKGGAIGYHTNPGFRTTWTQMFTGDFIGSVRDIGPDQVLLYDGSSGEVDVVGFDKNEPKGKAILDGQNSRYRGSSDIIAVGALVPK